MPDTISRSTVYSRMKRPVRENQEPPSIKHMVTKRKRGLSAVEISCTNGNQHLAKQKVRLWGTTKHRPIQSQSSGTTVNRLLGDQSCSLQVQNYQSATTMSEWLGEWDVAPSDPLPSKVQPLWLLTEPAAVDICNHKIIAQTVSLVHYHPTMVPEGRAAQEQAQAQRQFKEIWERQEVVVASRNAEVIDLTGDHVTERRPLALAPYATNVPRQLHFDPDFEMFPPSKACLKQLSRPNFPSCFMSQRPSTARSTRTKPAPVTGSWQEQVKLYASIAPKEYSSSRYDAIFDQLMHYRNS
ncbi:hypothetical protein DE146DRAFT_739445 [Phaeosphaeria sp. MPI-PUGE-AT-0046c]|nr:hypothetical protein DE146DRAFT_739445 [Phaeosphaeria sp. MPI-PUGE-AT-0046c]